MRTAILITSDGDFVNGNVDFLNASPIDGSCGFTLLDNQISLEFFDEVITQPSGEITPDFETAVTSGLSGTLTFTVFSSKYAPYGVAQTAMDISTTAKLFIPNLVIQSLTVNANTIAGCNYINIYVDRK